MALLGFDGFDGIAIGDIGLRGWSLVSNGFTTGSITTGLTGNALQLASAAGGFAGYEQPVASPTTSLIVQGHLRVNKLATATLMAIREGSVYHVSLGMDGAGRLILYRGEATTNLAQSATSTIAANTWHHVALVASISNSGGFVTVYVEGVQVATYTGDTDNGGATGVTGSFMIGTGSDVTTRWDDVVWLDQTGSAPYTSPLGPCKVERLPVNSDVATQFTRSTGSTTYTLLNEALPDGDTSYVESSTTGQQDALGVTDLSGVSSAVFAVQTRIRARRTDAASVVLIPSIASGGVDADGANRSLGSSYAEYVDLFPTNPDGAVAWTTSSVNAMNLAYRIG